MTEDMVDKSAISFVLSSVLASTNANFGLLGNGANTISDKAEKGRKTSAVISFPLLISFTIGVIGSLLSGAATCKLLHLFYGEIVGKSVRGVICCLTASYIGGTMNFFETAKCLKIESDNRVLINSMAAADIGVMVLYFSLLNALKHWSSKIATTSSQKPAAASASYITQDVVLDSDSIDTESSVIPRPKVIASALGMLSGSLGVSWIAGSLQQVLNVPGISSAVVTIFALQAVWTMRTLPESLRDMLMKSSSDCSQFLLLLFYSTLGLQTNLTQLAAIAAKSPLPLIFGTMLSVHLAVIVLGSYLWNAAVRVLLSWKYLKEGNDLKMKKALLWQIDLDSMLLASNACVGGSATAASMAVGSGPICRPDLVLSASFAGIIGYMLGTPLALWGFKMFK
eukprot:gene25126-33644_t